jgi:succinoglycan biosynthesis protein ExoM
MLISICVATYQRPEGLKRLMAGLDRLIFNQHEIPQIEVIIVDNDPTCSAQEFCEQLKSNFRWSLKYFVEPQQGVSYVRNKAIAEVAIDAEFVLFIDDDEVPEPAWVEELLLAQATYQADVVAGPSVPYFPTADVPEWVIKGKFFDLKRFPTGHSIDFAGAGNVLIRARILREMGKIFDERFALTGGEDTHFFMRVARAGYKLIWADLAVVYEWIPQSRINLKWILLRGFRSHSSYTICAKEFNPLPQVLVTRIFTGTGRIAFGIVSLLPSILLGRAFFVHAILQTFRGAGLLAGLIGRSYEEYKGSHHGN